MCSKNKALDNKDLRDALKLIERHSLSLSLTQNRDLQAAMQLVETVARRHGLLQAPEVQVIEPQYVPQMVA